jgi:hypothetical protein
VKKILKVGGSILVGLLVVVAVLRVTGFEPRLCYHSADSWTCKIPGLWLEGNLVTTPVSDWSFVDNYPEIKIQTRTRYLLPLSVTTYCMTYNGQLYVESTYSKQGNEYPRYPHGRVWNENVARDPHVRLKIGDQLYDRALVLVTDPSEQEAAIKAKAAKYIPDAKKNWGDWKVPPPEAPAIVYRVVPS